MHDSARILHVEDQEVCREPIARIARRSGGVLILDSAETLSEAFTLMASQVYDAILLDLCLPDSPGGVDTVHIVREFDRYIPIVVLTGTNSDELAALCRAAGASACIVKSSVISYEDIMTRLLAAVREREAAARADLAASLSASDSLRLRAARILRLAGLSDDVEQRAR